MKNLILRMLGQPTSKSSSDAKQRLKVLLVHDEIDLPPAKMEQMKVEILEVVARYVDVKEDQVTFKLNKSEGEVALVSSVPVRRVHARA
ncbi:MAG: cell division topological specificity factor MinE [Alphaproteobacteria bacterium]|nr:cell division topological specificity factor MinE [Alphaproteobacteria bacterium]